MITKFSLLNKLILLVVIFIYSTEFCYGQWQWVWPTPQGMKLNSVSFLDNSTGVFVGDDGVIMRTTNSGLNYTVSNLGFNYDLKTCLYLDQNLCFAAGSFSKIFRTTNFGVNWTSSDVQFNYGITDIFFINKTTGWASALYNSLYKTTNSGINWSHSKLPDYLSSANSIFFTNELTGYVAGNSSRFKIIKTTDGGSTWGRLDYNYSGSLNSIYFTDSLVGFTCGSEGNISKTTNGGNSWSLQNSGFNSGTFTSIKFKNITGYCTYQSENGICTIVKSTDEGNSWQTVYYDTLNSLTSIELNEQNIFAVGLLGRILKSTDNGENWSSNKGDVLNGFGYIKFINEMTGIASGRTFNYTLMHKTTNGGVNWNIQGRDSTVNSIFSTDFVDLNTGYKVGGNSNSYSRIYKTTNCGLKWNQMTIQTNETVAGVDFINADTGIVCGGGGLIAKTTNGAITWSITHSGGPHWHSAICFIDNTNCISGNSNGDVYKSTNGGITWFISATNVGISINSISFANPLTGYIGGNGVFKTTDGGYNWTNILPGLVSHNLEFYDSNTGFVSAYDGKIYRTTNGGINWINESYISGDLNFYSYCFIDAETVYMLGNIFLFKTTNGGVLTNHFENAYIVPASFHLLQNYPNPFNPSTTITFSLPKNSFVKLKVFDITGKEIRILVNEFKQSGSHSIKFEGSSLSSGVYYYKLETTDFPEIKKMLYIK